MGSHGPVAGSPPANAGDMDSIPGLGGSHVLQGNLSPCTTTTEALAPGALALQQEEPLQ